MSKKETFNYSNYSYRTKKESAYVPGVEVDDQEFFVCPGCRKEKKGGIEHGEEYRCSCRLKFQKFGNGLRVWK